MTAIVVAAAVIIEDRRVLLTQRLGGTHLESLWEFPGGKLEDGEAPVDALVRELREEIGIECRVGEILDVTFWRYPKRDVLLLFYRAERASLAAQIQHREVAAHAWVAIDELERYTIPPADVPVLTKVRALLAQ